MPRVTQLGEKDESSLKFSMSSSWVGIVSSQLPRNHRLLVITGAESASGEQREEVDLVGRGCIMKGLCSVAYFAP